MCDHLEGTCGGVKSAGTSDKGISKPLSPLCKGAGDWALSGPLQEQKALFPTSASLQTTKHFQYALTHYESRSAANVLSDSSISLLLSDSKFLSSRL